MFHPCNIYFDPFLYLTRQLLNNNHEIRNYLQFPTNFLSPIANTDTTITIDDSKLISTEYMFSSNWWPNIWQSFVKTLPRQSSLKRLPVGIQFYASKLQSFDELRTYLTVRKLNDKIRGMFHRLEGSWFPH